MQNLYLNGIIVLQVSFKLKIDKNVQIFELNNYMLNYFINSSSYILFYELFVLNNFKLQ